MRAAETCKCVCGSGCAKPFVQMNVCKRARSTSVYECKLATMCLRTKLAVGEHVLRGCTQPRACAMRASRLSDASS
eukprot:2110757-Pleurochrysis_carterae.AAC.1